MNIYHFKVNRATEVDIQRACNEAPDDLVALLIDGGARSWVLCLRQQFLSQFDVRDNRELCRDTLSLAWGSHIVPRAEPVRGRIAFDLGVPVQQPQLEGWRCVVIYGGDKRGPLLAIRHELERANKFLKHRRQVTVFQLP